MARTKGAQNILVFEKRNAIPTTASKEIKHLAKGDELTAFLKFDQLLRHQGNYLNWIETRHTELNAAKAELARLNNGQNRGTKNSTYRKYKWYAEQAVLLEAINGFEVFYKTSLISLARAIQNYIPPEKIKGAVDAKILWGIRRASVPDLVFEHRLYHDLDEVDKVCDSLISARRYNRNSPKSQMKEVNRALQAIFQIRHTLSHNHGLITVSDNTKLKILGYKASSNEVIDPAKNHLSYSVSTFLYEEAKNFTNWLLEQTAEYLKGQSEVTGLRLDTKIKDRIVNLIGACEELEKLDWK